MRKLDKSSITQNLMKGNKKTKTMEKLNIIRKRKKEIVIKGNGVQIETMLLGVVAILDISLNAIKNDNCKAREAKQKIIEFKNYILEEVLEKKEMPQRNSKNEQSKI